MVTGIHPFQVSNVVQAKVAVLIVSPLGKQTNLLPHLSFNRKMVLAELAQKMQRRQHGS